MGFFYKASAAAAAVEEYANYDAIPDGSDGDTARTTNNNQTWRYSGTAGCWIPSDFYDSGLAIQQDRSGTPKDINFTLPQKSDFSGLSGALINENGTGTVTDAVDGVTMVGGGAGNNTQIKFQRETHTGDSLLIADWDFQASGTQANFLTKLVLQNHSTQSNKTLMVTPSGVDKASSNEIIITETETAVGTAMRPVTGYTTSAGDRTFIRFNSGELVTGSSDEFVEVLSQDKDSRFTIRAPYDQLDPLTWCPIHEIRILTYNGTWKLTRFQLLKYT